MTDERCFSFEGRRVAFREGATIAAALLAAGEPALRETRSGRRRGLFCGMGVCHECLVRVDGRPGQRACMTAAAPGLDVARQPAAPIARPPDGRGTAGEATRDAPDVLVVGGGPAGLAAASAAAAGAGLRVVLVDERRGLGGQYFKQPAASGGAPADAQFAAGAALIERVRAAAVEVHSATRVWGAFAPDDLRAVGPRGRVTYAPRALVLAPGAYERGVPMPGWTLPGAMTTGAAQTLWRSYGTPPGRRVLVSGNGPLNLQVAAELARAGVTVVAVAELAGGRSRRRGAAIARLAVLDPELAVSGARYRATLARARVAVLPRTAVTAIEGETRVRAAVVCEIDDAGRPRPGTERRLEVDAVCLGFGFHPSTELARALGARHARRGDELATVVDATGRTSLDRVWVVGDGAWIGGARLAQSVGELAGIDAARTLGAAGGRRAGSRTRAVRRRADRHRRFQEALGIAFGAPRIEAQLAAPDTLVCRCEDASCAAIERALDDGAGHAGAVKRATRAGMGPCQGRYCGPVIATMAAQRTGVALAELSSFAPNPPVGPISIDALLGPEDGAALDRAADAAREALAGEERRDVDRG